MLVDQNINEKRVGLQKNEKDKAEVSDRDDSIPSTIKGIRELALDYASPTNTRNPLGFARMVYDCVCVCVFVWLKWTKNMPKRANQIHSLEISFVYSDYDQHREIII